MRHGEAHSAGRARLLKKTIAARCVVRDVYGEVHSAGRVRLLKKTIAARCVVRDVY